MQYSSHILVTMSVGIQIFLQESGVLFWLLLKNYLEKEICNSVTISTLSYLDKISNGTSNLAENCVILCSLRSVFILKRFYPKTNFVSWDSLINSYHLPRHPQNHALNSVFPLMCTLWINRWYQINLKIGINIKVTKQEFTKNTKVPYFSWRDWRCSWCTVADYAVLSESFRIILHFDARS